MLVRFVYKLVIYSRSGCSAGMPLGCVLAPMVVAGVCGCAIGHSAISKGMEYVHPCCMHVIFGRGLGGTFGAHTITLGHRTAPSVWY